MSNNSHIDFSMLLASSIHDMKNSLCMLLHSLDVMFERAEKEATGHDEELSVLQYEASRVNRDLIQLLGLYRLQENELPVNIDEHMVFDVIDEQVIVNQRLISTQNLTINICCDEELVWYLDNSLIGGVINNVLINATRYSNTCIDISADMDGDFLKITIADDGPGYPAGMLEDPIDQMKSIDFSSGSTSLGIYFAHHIAELHKHNELQGFIKLENGGALGGSQFSLYIP